MARGKNKAVAERRKAALSEIGTIDTLRLRVKNLEEELAEAKQRYDASIEAKNDNIRELSRKLKENTTDELEEAKALISKLKEDLGTSRKDEALIRKRWVRLVDVIVEHYESVHRMDRVDVLASLVGIEDGQNNAVGDGPLVAPTDLIDKLNKGKLTEQQVKIMSKKRRGLI